MSSAEQLEGFSFVLLFAQVQSEMEKQMLLLIEQMAGDGVLWVAFPKSGSKKYTCDFNRDLGWDKVIAEGVLPVRIISLNPEYSALRFRKKQYISKITRKF